MLVRMSDVTQILNRIEHGQGQSDQDLFPLVYAELRRLAAGKMSFERSDHTLSATAWVHEAYVRLVDRTSSCRWDNRGHFFAAAAEAMRRILIDHARRRSSQKRGGGVRRVDADLFAASVLSDADLLVDVDEGISRLAEEDPEAAQLIKLRLYAGLSVSEAGKLLGMSRTSAYANWKYIRSWFAVHYSNDC